MIWQSGGSIQPHRSRSSGRPTRPNKNTVWALLNCPKFQQGRNEIVRHNQTVRLSVLITRTSSLGFLPVVSKLWCWRCSQKDGSFRTAPREVNLAPNPPSGKRCFPPESYSNLFFLGPLRSICRPCCC